MSGVTAVNWDFEDETAHPRPHPSDRPVRILFVFAFLDPAEDVEVRMLARHLDPERYRVDAIACFQPENTYDYPIQRLEAVGVTVDTTPYTLSFEDTVTYLARKLVSYELVISLQDVADIYPALERLKIRPPLIEYGRTITNAISGPKHFTARYVGATQAVADASARLMPNNPHHAVLIASMTRGVDLASSPEAKGAVEPHPAVAPWIEIIESVLREVPNAPAPRLFRSFHMGGFECSTHRLRNGRRLDVIASIGHDLHAEADYRQLKAYGMATIRDGVRWHLIESTPGVYDFSSLTPMLLAADRAGVQVIWDILHYGWPDDIDIWTPVFVERFTAFARALGEHVKKHSDAPPFWCPVNEISYLSWAGGDVGYMNPFALDRGFELKCQLARAAISAIDALRGVDPRARFVQCEPGVAVHHDPDSGYSRIEAEAYHDRQYQAFSLLDGSLWPQIGGDPSYLDIVGLNYYMHNQRLYEGAQIDLDHAQYKPLSDILFETYARFGRPIIISETGIEGERRAAWFSYVITEVERARVRGVPVEGVCIYPVADHPGWDDDRLCPNGMLSHCVIDSERKVHKPLAGILESLHTPAGKMSGVLDLFKDRRTGHP